MTFFVHSLGPRGARPGQAGPRQAGPGRAGVRCAGALALLAFVGLTGGCHPPAEQARAAQLEFAPLLLPVPRIAPEVTVRPPAPPPPMPVPPIRPVLMLASLPGGPPDLFVRTSGESKEASDEPPVVPDFEILGQRVAPGTFARLSWTPTESFTGNSAASAVLVAHGTEPGPTLCLTAAIHGDELNGIETVRRVLHDLEPERLAGTVVGVPIVNLQGFHRNSRYLPDRRDLNRYFPGNPTGSAASRIAHSLFNRVIRHCSALVDLHTGSFHRTNLPQVRGDLNNEAVVKLTAGFGSTVILHSGGGEGTLRRAAVDAGIPAVTLEAGMPLQVQEAAVEHSVKAIFTLLDTFGMYNKRSLWGNPEPVYYQSRWVRADHGGILSGEVNLGRRVQPGDLLGTVTDPITNERNVILSPYHGRVIGMALDQFVMPGYATFHIGIEAEVAEATELPPEDEDAGDHADEGGDEGFDGLMEGD